MSLIQQQQKNVNDRGVAAVKFEVKILPLLISSMEIIFEALTLFTPWAFDLYEL